MNEHCADCGGPDAYGGPDACACCYCIGDTLDTPAPDVTDLADTLGVTLHAADTLAVLRQAYALDPTVFA